MPTGAAVEPGNAPGSRAVPPPAPPIAVLGMHRSGTSCLAGLLEDAGVWFGPVSTHNPANLKGNRENRAIRELHDAVLADNGASWHTPPASACRWQPERIAALTGLVDTFPGDRTWGFKDPRCLFTLDGWLTKVPSLRMIGSFRHPLAVAHSLLRRNHMPLADGIALWQAYNERVHQLHQRHGFDLVCFDLDDDAYLEAALAAFRRLGLDTDKQRYRFFDPQLRSHHGGAPSDLPKPVERLYQKLIKASGAALG